MHSTFFFDNELLPVLPHNCNFTCPGWKANYSRLMLCRGCRTRAGPRRLDVHQAAKIKPSSLVRYQKSVATFHNWLSREGYNPETFEVVDDLVVEFKNSELISKSNFEQLIAGLEFLFPRMKGQLQWARAVSAGWSVTYIPRHTTPLSKGVAHLFAVHMVSLKHARVQ